MQFLRHLPSSVLGPKICVVPCGPVRQARFRSSKKEESETRSPTSTTTENSGGNLIGGGHIGFNEEYTWSNSGWLNYPVAGESQALPFDYMLEWLHLGGMQDCGLSHQSILWAWRVYVQKRYGDDQEFRFFWDAMVDFLSPLYQLKEHPFWPANFINPARLREYVSAEQLAKDDPEMQAKFEELQKSPAELNNAVFNWFEDCKDAKLGQKAVAVMKKMHMPTSPFLKFRYVDDFVTAQVYEDFDPAELQKTGLFRHSPDSPWCYRNFSEHHPKEFYVKKKTALQKRRETFDDNLEDCRKSTHAQGRYCDWFEKMVEVKPMCGKRHRKLSILQI